MMVSGGQLAKPGALPLEDAAAGATEISRQPLTARTGPTDQPTRIADHEPVCGHSLITTVPAPMKDVFPDSYAGDHHNSGTQGGSTLNGGLE